MSAPKTVAVPTGDVNDAAIMRKLPMVSKKRSLGKALLRIKYLTSRRYELLTPSSTNDLERPVFKRVSKNKEILTRYF